MKILHVMAGGEYGGAETACIDMCIAMKEAGQDIAVITRPNPPRITRLKEAGIDVHTLPFGGKIDLYTPLMIKRIIKIFEPDIVQTWMSRAASKTPRYRPSSGGKPYKTFARLGNYYKMKYFKTIEYFISITPDIATYIANNDVPDDHIRHINNFAETETVITAVKRADYGVPDDATLLLGLGRLHDDKAFDTLIEAVKQLKDHGEQVYLWIAGEGPDRAALESQIVTSGVQDRVQLLGWRDDRAALLQACDICMFTSRDEPFGTVFVQSWAQKTPVIVSDADGPRQFVHDGEDGLITPINDTQAITQAVIRLKNDEKLCNTLIQNGYNRYTQEFTKEKSVDSYLDFYNFALKN